MGVGVGGGWRNCSKFVRTMCMIIGRHLVLFGRRWVVSSPKGGVVFTKIEREKKKKKEEKRGWTQ